MEVAQQRKIASRTGHAAQVTRQRPFRCRQRCSVRSSPLLRDQHAVTAADAAQLLAAPAFCLQDTAAALLQLVERRMLPALLASSDWSALVDALDAAPDAVIHARQRSRQSQQQQQQQAHQPRLPQQLPQQQQRAQHGWGFALRQPGAPRQQSAAAVNSLQLASPEAASPTWNRHSVVTLRLLGLGSIAELAPRCRAAGSNGMPPPRLGLRLAQLALATALARHALPGLTALPVAFDPACDLNGLDGALLAGLGFDAVRTEPPLAVDAADLPGGSTLLYLPCAPRQLAERVLVANPPGSVGRARLAVLGSAMSSFADSTPLLRALEGHPAACSSGDGDSSSNGRGSGDGGGGLMQEEYARGGVVEVPCPDCAAHGVAVAVHVFP